MKKFAATIFFLLLLFVAPSKTSAQEVGSHLGAGDIGTQKNNINILKSNGAGDGFPVTALLNINTTVQNGADDLLNEIQSANFFPIIRLTHVCDSLDAGLTPDAAVQALRAKLDSRFSDYLIVYGNEVNNGDTECSTGKWQGYVDDFRSISNKSKVSPSAFDYYMGNPSYTVDEFKASTVGHSSIFNHSPRAGNAYGCVGQSANDCEPSSTTTQTTGYSPISGELYLTEFSLSPEGKKSDAPDTDLFKVKEFIETHAGSTGAKKITPLVRNVCNGEGEWLLYVNGEFFTWSGTKIDPASCDGFSSSGYDLSKYPNYDSDPNWYYIQPLAGVGAPIPPEQQLSIIRDDLAGQGYEAHCAAKKMKIKPEYDTESLISKYFQLYPSGVKVLSTDSNLSLNYSSSGYPLWRDTDGIQFLTSSIEEYFGFRDIYESDPAKTELTSAPIESLLSEFQRCKASLVNLRAMYWMCTLKQLNAADCALYAQKIPGTSKNINQFQEFDYDPMVKDLESRNGRSGLHYLDGGVTRFCTALMEDAVDDSLPNRQEIADFKGDLLNIPIYQNRTYRLAFLVAAVEQKSALGNPPPIFNFFAKDQEAADPKHEVLISAFRIPDIGTNKGGLESGGGIDFDDPLIYTRNSLLKRDTHEKIKAKGERLRRERKEDAARKSGLGGAGTTIHCYNGAFPNGGGTTTCNNPLGKAVVDIINADSPSCGNDLKVEHSQFIEELTGVVPPPADAPSRLYQPQYGNILLQQLFLDDDTHPGNFPEVTQENFSSIFHLDKDNWAAAKGDTEVEFYIVYPFGYDYESVTEAISTQFFAKNQFASILADPASENERFPIHNDGIDFSGDSDSFTFIDIGNPCNTIPDPLDPSSYLDPCDAKDVTVKVKSEDNPSASVFGAKLGFWMRKMQQAFNPLFSEAHNYITSCETTEEFLLGRCVIKGSAINNRYSCKDLATKQVPVPNYQQVADKVCQAANTNRPPEIPAAMWQQLVWGILQIEGSPFLRAVRSGQSTTSCGPISVCGAVGPMQIINGQCATDACPNPGAKNLVRTGDFCTLEGSLQWAVGYLRGNIGLAKAANPAANGNAEALAHTLAGKYHGIPDSQLATFNGNHCFGAPAVQGCGGLNYCECAMQIQSSLLRGLNAPSCN